MSTAAITALLLLPSLVAACSSTPAPPVEFQGASGDMHGTLDVTVSGIPVRVELDTLTTTDEGDVVEGRVSIITPLGGVECDLHLDDGADCHQVTPSPLPAPEARGIGD